MNQYLAEALAAICIGIACAIAVPGQPDSAILTVVLTALWHLTVHVIKK